MVDREKVMSWLEGLSQEDWRIFHSDSEVQVIAEYALTLLKEQPEIVRCKDCKNAEVLKWLDNAIICKKHNFSAVRPDEFYCADGDRREDNA